MVYTCVQMFLLFPACAGVILVVRLENFVHITFPRVCGGDPKYTDKMVKGTGFSPRVRG